MSTLDRAHNVTGYPAPVLRGPYRLPEICRARFAVMAAMRKRGLSLEQIGRVLHRHHTTVLTGLRRADEIAACDPRFIELVEAIG